MLASVLTLILLTCSFQATETERPVARPEGHLRPLSKAEISRLLTDVMIVPGNGVVLVSGGELFRANGVHIYAGRVYNIGTFTVADGQVCVQHGVEQCRSVLVDDRGTYFSDVVMGMRDEPPRYVPFSVQPIMR